MREAPWTLPQPLEAGPSGSKESVFSTPPATSECQGEGHPSSLCFKDLIGGGGPTPTGLESHGKEFGCQVQAWWGSRESFLAFLLGMEGVTLQSQVPAALGKD